MKLIKYKNGDYLDFTNSFEIKGILLTDRIPQAKVRDVKLDLMWEMEGVVHVSL